MENGSALGSYRYSIVEYIGDKRKIDDGVFMVVIDSIYGGPVWVVIDSDPTRYFVFLIAVLPLGLHIIKY